MKARIVFIVVFFTFFTISAGLFAQKDYSSKLKKEIVKIENGNFSSKDYMYLSFDNGSSLQVKVTAVCPVDVMNRDNFISLYSSYSTMLMLATLAQWGLAIPDIKDLDELIGEPDLTYNFIMAKNGMQIQVITAQGKNNVTTTWEEIFAE